MAKKPESRYIDKVHRQLHKDIWKIRMQMGMGSPRGIPDFLYRGPKCDLWVEYKFIPDWKTKRIIPRTMIKDNQEAWLQQAHELQGPNKHAVIIGDENGLGVILSTYNLFESLGQVADYEFLSPKEVARWIERTIT